MVGEYFTIDLASIQLSTVKIPTFCDTDSKNKNCNNQFVLIGNNLNKLIKKNVYKFKFKNL